MHYIGLLLIVVAGFAYNSESSAKDHRFTQRDHEMRIGNISHEGICNSSYKIELNEMTAGVLSLKPGAKGVIKLYDNKNEPGISIDLNGELNEAINPYSGFLEYEILVFRVIKSDSVFHHVIVNEQNGTIGKIKKNESALRYQQWSEHVMNAFSVDFDPVKNPLRKDTLANSKSVYDNNVEFYQPAGMNGDWLKVSWDKNNSKRFGWIRWKKGKTLLVDLNYIP